MAARLERNLPTFTGSEVEGDPLSEMVHEDSDADDGEDIFMPNSNPQTASQEASVAETANREMPPDLFSEEETKTICLPSANPGMTSRSNAVLSDDENYLFAATSVEQYVENPTSKTREDQLQSSGPIRLSSLTPSSAASQLKSMEQLEEEEARDDFIVDVAVTNPEKVGEGMNAYMVYKVATRTTLPMFRNRTFSVRRRFSDFLGLYEKLSEKQSLYGYIVPPPPEKSVVGMTKVKVGKDDPASAEFVERRRLGLERYLQRVVSHPLLLQDPDVREFLERDELPRAVSTQALSGAGFLKMINKASDAVNKMSVKINESETWFEDKLQEVESEEQQLRKLHSVVDSLVIHRKELCWNTSVFSKSMAMLGTCEENTALSRALCQLAEVEDKMEQLHQGQAASDFFIFAELLGDYIRLLGAVRVCFEHRVRAWQRWQEAQSILQKKREVEAKLLWANKPDKLQQAKEEITEWEARVTQYERDFDRIGVSVRKEFLRFEKEKSKDFKSQIVKYLESQLNSQQRRITFWEAFLPEAQAIA